MPAYIDHALGEYINKLKNKNIRSMKIYKV